MRPCCYFIRFLLAAAVVITAIELAIVFWPKLQDYFWLLFVPLVLCLGALLFDALALSFYKVIHVERQLPNSLALGRATEVTLLLRHDYNRTLWLTLVDACPDLLCAQAQLPQFTQIRLPPQKILGFSYFIKPKERGDFTFLPADLLIASPWRFWQKKIAVGPKQTVKVFPNYAQLAQFEGVALDDALSGAGMHVQPKRGEGMEFHQMREYREGDALRQIDWKSTARFNKLISKQYQDERDQEVIFALDCGRRLRNKESEFSHFDHCLNALLLSAYVAVKKGDSVGLFTFAGITHWFKPQKGHTAVSGLLNKVYNLQPSTQTTDFLVMAQALLQKQTKRALVIIVTSVWPEDQTDLLAAVTLLRKKHRVLVASLRDGIVDEVLATEVTNKEAGLTYGGVADYALQRRLMLQQLLHQGVHIVDALPATMHQQLAYQYLALKRAGVL